MRSHALTRGFCLVALASILAAACNSTGAPLRVEPSATPPLPTAVGPAATPVARDADAIALEQLAGQALSLALETIPDAVLRQVDVRLSTPSFVFSNAKATEWMRVDQLRATRLNLPPAPQWGPGIDLAALNVGIDGATKRARREWPSCGGLQSLSLSNEDSRLQWLSACEFLDGFTTQRATVSLDGQTGQILSSKSVLVRAEPTPTPRGGVPTVTPTPTPRPTPVPTVGPTATPGVSTARVGSATYTIEVARTQEQQATGLGNRDSLSADAGMLFPMSRSIRPLFWMKGMRFALDFVWIGADCRVADLTANVPAQPGVPDNLLATYAPKIDILFVFEINAGQIAARGIKIGDAVSFNGTGVQDLTCAATRA
ncbi:MAG: DUF192 domain-containing protein [Chloroflexi bacterium]|nr:DUF192 domain-containing protein [Chloroflexota bacterium]